MTGPVMYLFLCVISPIVFVMFWLSVFLRIMRTIRGTKQLRSTIQNQQAKIDKLEHELEDMKRK
ncbi:MAG: hypothetical protein FWC50_01770 [Planctomycetaceae bacterium]|nr:hypothetical protein [Planctomycetaceae bacterium]